MRRWSMSAADRVLACPASLVLPQARQPASEHAVYGTGVHQYLRDVSVHGLDQARALVPDDAEWADACAVLDPTPLWAGASRRWTEHTLAFQPESGDAQDCGADLERRYPDLGDGWIFGTMDLAADTDGVLTIYDYKTGRHAPRPEAAGQLALLALAARAAWGYDEIHVGIVEVREDGTYRVDAADVTWQLDAWHARVLTARREEARAAAAVARGDMPDVATGEHCRYCPAAHACPAQVALARAIVTDATAPEAYVAQLGSLSREDAGRAYTRLLQAERLLDAVKSALRRRIDAEPDGLPLGDGNAIVHTTTRRESLDVSRVVEVLTGAGIARDAVDQAVSRSITKAAVERLARSAGVNPKHLFEAIAAAGGVIAKDTTSYRVTKDRA